MVHRRRRGSQLPSRPRGHRQRPPDCCATYAACYGPDSPCVDCEVLEMADTRLGLAILFGWSPRGGGLADLGPGVSVLDALILAEEELSRRPAFTRIGRSMRNRF